MKVLEPSSKEYKYLEVAAKLLEAKYPERKYVIQDCYLDYGQAWMWTTIICTKDERYEGEYQAITPMDWKIITQATSIEDLLKRLGEVVK